MTPEEYLAVYKVKPCLEGLSRNEITDTLSRQLELQVLARRNALASGARSIRRGTSLGGSRGALASIPSRQLF